MSDLKLKTFAELCDEVLPRLQEEAEKYRDNPPPPPMKNPTWTKMCHVEQDLLGLYIDAMNRTRDEESKNKRCVCANHIWYQDFKPRLRLLVGWEARNPLLWSSECYDVAYQKIYDAMPECRECGCICI